MSIILLPIGAGRILYLAISVLAVIFAYFMLTTDDLLFFEDIISDGAAYNSSLFSHALSKVKTPVILWWTPFTGEVGSTRICNHKHCFFTIDRRYYNYSNGLPQVIVFYGSDFQPSDLPLPRLPHHTWALLHEESPKNVFSFNFAPVLSLFNFTSTFRRESDFPLTTQYLKDLDTILSLEYFVPTIQKSRLRYFNKLAPVVYVHSDCDVPSDRDFFVRQLMKYISVDSYGECEHNRDLDEHLRNSVEAMEHCDFYHLMAQYKFTIVAENAACSDYITEKYWRTLMLGSVPVILDTSNNIRDFLPDDNSAVFVDEFESFTELADFLLALDSNDTAYSEFLNYKHTGIKNAYLTSIMENRTWTIPEDEINAKNSPNFIEAFECFLCQQAYELASPSKRFTDKRATIDHYGCPMPLQIDRNAHDRIVWIENEEWKDFWYKGRIEGKAIYDLANRNVSFSLQQLVEKARELV